MNAEPKKTPDNAGALYRSMLDANVPPHERFANWQSAWGMSDGELATVLEVTRPEVQRTREAVRPPSFNIAVRVEAVMGIPAAHWRPVPTNVRLRAKWYADAATAAAKAAKAKPAKPTKRKRA